VLTYKHVNEGLNRLAEAERRGAGTTAGGSGEEESGRLPGRPSISSGRTVQ